jgi:hypothetical protein
MKDIVGGRDTSENIQKDRMSLSLSQQSSPFSTFPPNHPT